MLKDQLFFSVTCRSLGSFVLSGWWKVVHREVWQGFHSTPFLGMSTFLGSTITYPDTLTVALQLFFQEYLIFLSFHLFFFFQWDVRRKTNNLYQSTFLTSQIYKKFNCMLIFLNTILIEKGKKRSKCRKIWESNIGLFLSISYSCIQCHIK